MNTNPHTQRRNVELNLSSWEQHPKPSRNDWARVIDSVTGYSPPSPPTQAAVWYELETYPGSGATILVRKYFTDTGRTARSVYRKGSKSWTKPRLTPAV